MIMLGSFYLTYIPLHISLT